MPSYKATVWRCRKLYQSTTVVVTEEELKERLGEDPSAWTESEIRGEADDIANMREDVIWNTDEVLTEDGGVRSIKKIEKPQ